MTTRTTTEPAAADARAERGQRWTARGAFAAILAAVVVLVASEGPIGLTLLVVGLLGTVVVLVGGYWFIAKRGVAAVDRPGAGGRRGRARRGDLLPGRVSSRWRWSRCCCWLLGGAAARHALRHDRRTVDADHAARRRPRSRSS